MDRSFDRRAFMKVTGTAGLVGLAGCAGGPTDEGEGGTETTAAEDTTTEGGNESGTPETGTAETQTETEGEGTPEGEGGVHVGMVYATGGLGDGSFNDQAQSGIERAAGEFDLSYAESEPDQVSQFTQYQQQYAQSTDPNYDLVSCIGFLQSDALAQTAPQYPDQDFVIVDAVPTNESGDMFDNVAAYTFKEHEGSFLVGQLAGMLTTREFSAGAGETSPDAASVGFVGGVESGLIRRFEAGYRAGVAHANGDVGVQSTYVGSFSEPTAGREAAAQMYSNGADVVYHAAGNTGTGVFQAAQENDAFAVGVDRDQSVTLPDYADVILASMVKRVDTAVFNAAQAVVNGNFQGGTAVTLGLQENGVELVYGSQLGSEIPEEVKTAVAEARQGIIDGNVSVPTDPSEV